MQKSTPVPDGPPELLKKLFQEALSYVSNANSFICSLNEDHNGQVEVDWAASDALQYQAMDIEQMLRQIAITAIVEGF